MKLSISTSIRFSAVLALVACSFSPAVGQDPTAPTATPSTSAQIPSPEITRSPDEQKVVSQGQPPPPPLTPGVDPRLIGPCSHKHPYDPYKPPPSDLIQEVVDGRKRYRLVIGAGKNQYDQTANRDYVDKTAELIDAKLAKLHYDPLPSFVQSASPPYLAGVNATKEAIMNALAEMHREIGSGDIGVIYYVGHGGVTPSNRDVILSVYDRPIANDEGIRVDDLLGTLEVNRTISAVKVIPSYLIVLDSCLSGNAAQGNKTVLVDDNGVQRIAEIEGRIVPPQVAILTSTESGRDPEAYQLAGTNYSAFGFFFARALDEDWDCVDKPQPDGILTLDEISEYLEEKLALAYSYKKTPAKMKPTLLEKDKQAFIAYDAQKRTEDGLREKLKKMFMKSDDPAFAAEVRFSTGESLRCAEPTGCSFVVSESLIRNSPATMQQTAMTVAEVASGWSALNATLVDYTPPAIRTNTAGAAIGTIAASHGSYVATVLSRDALTTYVDSMDVASTKEAAKSDEASEVLWTSAWPSTATVTGKPSLTPAKNAKNKKTYQIDAEKVEAVDRLALYYSPPDTFKTTDATISKAQWKKYGGQGDYSSYQQARIDAASLIKNVYDTTTIPASKVSWLNSSYDLSVTKADGPVSWSSPDTPSRAITRSPSPQNLKGLLDGKTIEAGGVFLAVQ